jgi:hypothetical protein
VQPIILWHKYKKSSVSTKTVPNLATVPPKAKKNVKNANCPVDLLKKFVIIYGTLERITIVKIMVNRNLYRK